MIHHTITFVAITTLNLAFVTFTVATYSTDAAIWSQTEVTTDWKGHSSGTFSQQLAAAIKPESFAIVSSKLLNKLYVCLENLVSAFNTVSYVGYCSGLLYHIIDYKCQHILYDCEFPQEPIRTAWELCGKFNMLMKTAFWFICTGNTIVGLDVTSMARIYVHNFTEFKVGMDGRAATIDQVAVLDTVAVLYTTSIQKVVSVMELVELVTEMLAEEDKYRAMKGIILQQLGAINFDNKITFHEFVIGKQKELVNFVKNISEKAGNTLEHIYRNPFINVITSGLTSRFVYAQYWAMLLEQETNLLAEYETSMSELLDWHFRMYKVMPVIVAIILVLGITGNGLLLTIFVRHKETRTPANTMLINLTVVDLISLVVNGLLDYLRVIFGWKFGWLSCKVYFTFTNIVFAVSTYSVAMISFQRYMAVTQLPSRACHNQPQKIKYVLIATVWGIGCLLSSPHTLTANIDNNICVTSSTENGSLLYTTDLITVCVVPLLITAVFSGLTAYKIRRSACEIPGEVTGQQRLKHSRIVSSNVLFALTVLFVVSYAPYFFFNFIGTVLRSSIANWEFTLVNTITHFLRFVNCCFNPFVLFVLSKQYRGYIKRCCGQRHSN